MEDFRRRRGGDTVIARRSARETAANRPVGAGSGARRDRFISVSAVETRGRPIAMAAVKATSEALPREPMRTIHKTANRPPCRIAASPRN